MSIRQWTVGAALVALTQTGCDRRALRTDVRVPAASVATAQCRWSGEQTLGAGATLASAPGGPAIARFTGRVVPIEVVVRASDTAQHRASVRVDGLVFNGWIERVELRLRARRPVALAREHLVIERASAVWVEPTGGALRMRARFAPISTSAAVECDAIEVGEPGATRRESVSDAVHVRAERAALYAGPSGPPIGWLETSGRIPTLSRVETVEGRVHVRAAGAVSTDGWLDRARIEEGEGPDCDDCDDYGVTDVMDTADAMERCDNPDEPSRCPETSSLEVWSGALATITSEPRSDAARVGTIERGARFFVRERRADGWLSVIPARFLVDAGGGGFWVRR